jgi:acyl carrier protein
MRDKVLRILKEALPQIDFEASDLLVDDGILDSLSVVTLISKLSVEFGVIFDLDELTPDNLNSVDSITDTVSSLMSRKV